MKKLFFIISLFLVSETLFSQMNITNLDVDTTITNFKFANSLDGLYLYLPNGLNDYEKGINTSSFGILIKDSFDIDKTNQLLDFMIEDLEANKKHKYSEVENKNSFHNNGLYREVTIEESNLTNDDTLTATYYYAFALKKNQAIIFLSADFDNGKNYKKFVETFWKLKV